MAILVKYNGWLADMLGRENDTVSKPESQNGIIEDIFSQLHLLTPKHKKYLDLDFVKIFVDGKIIDNYQTTCIQDEIFVTVPTFA